VAATADGRRKRCRSARLHGAADHALAELGETLEPLERGLRDLDCQRLRAAMGNQAFDAEYTTGRSLTTDEVLTLALGNRA
jgi:hypothetical protein